MPETNLPHENPHIKVPNELWFALLKACRCPAGGFSTAVKLFDGTVLQDVIVSDRGYILGRIALGIAGAHGDIDVSMLNFTTSDIEAIQVPAFHFWQHRKWIELNPEHPARRELRARPKQ